MLYDTFIWTNCLFPRETYLGRPAGMELPANDVEHLHFPGISSEAARLLVAR